MVSISRTDPNILSVRHIFLLRDLRQWAVCSVITYPIWLHISGVIAYTAADNIIFSRSSMRNWHDLGYWTSSCSACLDFRNARNVTLLSHPALSWPLHTCVKRNPRVRFWLAFFTSLLRGKSQEHAVVPNVSYTVAPSKMLKNSMHPIFFNLLKTLGNAILTKQLIYTVTDS